MAAVATASATRAWRPPHSRITVRDCSGKAKTLLARSEDLALRGSRADTAEMKKKSEPTKPVLWDIYVSIGGAERGHVGMLVGTVEAADENEAIGKAPARVETTRAEARARSDEV